MLEPTAGKYLQLEETKKEKLSKFIYFCFQLVVVCININSYRIYSSLIVGRHCRLIKWFCFLFLWCWYFFVVFCIVYIGVKRMLDSKKILILQPFVRKNIGTESCRNLRNICHKECRRNRCSVSESARTCPCPSPRPNRPVGSGTNRCPPVQAPAQNSIVQQQSLVYICVY